jgi:hypothetical protein
MAMAVVLFRAEDREEVCAPAQIVFVINNERIAACDTVF